MMSAGVVTQMHNTWLVDFNFYTNHRMEEKTPGKIMGGWTDTYYRSMRRVPVWLSAVASALLIMSNVHQVLIETGGVVGTSTVTPPVRTYTGVARMARAITEQNKLETLGETVNNTKNATTLVMMTSWGSNKEEQSVLHRDLINAPYSRVLLTDLEVGQERSFMMVHTLSTNVLAFDGKKLAPHYPAMCYTDMFFSRSNFVEPKDSLQDKEVFQYADKSRYCGNMGKSNVKLNNVFLEGVVFGYINAINDAALILRAIDHGGVLGLNPFAKALYGGTNFLKAMVDQGFIADPSFAFSVAPDGKSQQLILGGVGKRDRRSLVYFPVVGLSPDKEPSSWAMKVEKLMFNDEVILQNFVAEFDSSLPYGLSSSGQMGRGGSLAETYTEQMRNLLKLKEGDIYKDSTGELRVDCGIRRSLPYVLLVARDEKGALHKFTFDGKDLFSPDSHPPKRGEKKWCQSSFFEDPQLDEEEMRLLMNHDVDVASKRGSLHKKAEGGGSEDADANLTFRFGLRIMKKFHTMDFRAEEGKPRGKNKVKKGDNLSGQIGIGYTGKWFWSKL